MARHRNTNPRLSAQWPGLVAKLLGAQGLEVKTTLPVLVVSTPPPPITQPPDEVSSPDTSRVSMVKKKGGQESTDNVEV
eukprot:276391-Ditylum_brightwellii.AAC.1